MYIQPTVLHSFSPFHWCSQKNNHKLCKVARYILTLLKPIAGDLPIQTEFLFNWIPEGSII